MRAGWALLMLTLVACQSLPAAQVSTLVDGGKLKFSPSVRLLNQDHEPRTGWQPHDLAIADDGRVWVADTQHHRILQISATGIIDVLAGSGQSGFKNGKGPEAQFDTPHGIYWTGSELLVADTGNQAIRRISAAGETSTLKLQGKRERPVSVLQDTQGRVIVADAGRPALLSYDADGTEHLLLQLSANRLLQKVQQSPDGRIFYADNYGLWELNGSIWRLDGHYPVFLEAGTDSFSRLGGWLFLSANKLLLSDTYGHRLLEYQDGKYASLLAHETDHEAMEPTGLKLRYPGALASNRQGTVVVADLRNERVQRLQQQQGQWQVSTLAENGTQGFGVRSDGEDLGMPHNLLYVAASQEVWVSDYFNHRLLRINPQGEATPWLEKREGRPALVLPTGLARTPDGTLYIASSGNHSIYRYRNQQLTLFAGSGKASLQDGQGEAASFNLPWGLCLDSTQNLYVADHGNHALRKITPTGQVSTLAGTGQAGFRNGPGASAQFHHPVDVYCQPNGKLWLSDSWNHQIREISPEGYVRSFTGQTKAGLREGSLPKAQFYLPSGLAMAPDGSLLVADTYNHRLRQITPSGEVKTLSGLGRLLNWNSGTTDGKGEQARFYQPRGLSVNPQTHELYVADTGNHRIRVVRLAP